MLIMAFVTMPNNKTYALSTVDYVKTHLSIHVSQSVDYNTANTFSSENFAEYNSCRSDVRIIIFLTSSRYLQL